jgi:Lipase (class 3)
MDSNNMSARRPALNQSFAQDAFTAAELAYKPDQPLPKDWKTVPPPKGLEADFKTSNCVHLVSPQGDHYISFRGTTDRTDWANNLGQGSTTYRPQYDAAARIGEHFRDHRDTPGYDYNVTYAGHSLGGGKAQLAAEVASQTPKGNGGVAEPQTCVAINSAPVHRETYQAHGCDPHRHSCTTLELENTHDLLTMTRDLTPTMAGSIAQSTHRDVTNARQGANTITTGAANLARDAANTVSSTVASGANAITSGVTTGANAIASGASSLASGVASGANSVAQGVHGAATSVASGLGSGASSVASTIATTAAYYAPAPVYNFAARFLNAGYNAAASLGSAGYQVAANTASLGANAATSVGSAAASLGSTVASTVGSVGSTVASGVGTVGSTVASGVGTVGSTVASGVGTVGSAAVALGAATYVAAKAPVNLATAAWERSSINEARLQGDRYQVKIEGAGAFGTVKDPATGHYMTAFDKNVQPGQPTQITADIVSIQHFGGLQPVGSMDLKEFDNLKPSPQRLLHAAVDANSHGSKALEMPAKGVGRGE